MTVKEPSPKQRGQHDSLPPPVKALSYTKHVQRSLSVRHEELVRFWETNESSVLGWGPGLRDGSTHHIRGLLDLGGQLQGLVGRRQLVP